MLSFTKPKMKRILCIFKWSLFFYILTQLIPTNQLFASALMSDSKESMKGQVLRVVLVHYPPAIIITKQPDGTFSYRGSIIDFLDYFARALDISYEYIHISPEDIKKYALGPAQMNPILQGLGDLAPYGVLLSLSKYEVIDVSIPILMQPYSLVVPWPKEENRLLAPVRPFQPLVWLFLGLTLLVLPPVLSYISALYGKYVDRRNNQPPHLISFDNLANNAMFLLSHLTNQGYRYEIGLRSRGSFILVGIWCLVCVVLSNAYAGTLFSFLSVTKLEPAIDSVKDLAYNTDNVTLLVQSNSVFADQLLDAKSGPEKLIGDTLRAYPENLISDLQEVKAKLTTGKYAFAFFPFYHNMLIDSIYRENNKMCRVTLAKRTVSLFSPACMALAKDGPYTTAINEQIQAILEAGLLDYFFKKFMPRIDQCLMEHQQADAHQKPLSLTDMASAFVIFGLGMSLSVLVFLLEIIYAKVKKHCGRG